MGRQEKQKQIPAGLSIPEALEKEWRFLRKLDEGGQAIPILCEKIHARGLMQHKNTEHAVLKILNAGITDIDLERMKREIQVLNETNHPNVIKPIRWDNSVSPRWYLMPYGRPLKKKWKSYREQNKNDSVAIFTESTRIIRSLLLGLQQLHNRNYVHRDIKPDNVIFSGSDEALLIDLGIIYHPEFNPITSEKGAGNRFVLISSSIKASPYVDCLGIASLWAWLVAKDPNISYGHYHWKYIDLIGDDWRYEIIRATLANCSHELSAPRNAGQMLEMLDAQYNLKFSMGGNNTFETEIQEALVAQIKAITQSDLVRANQRNILEAAAAIGSNPLKLVKDSLKDSVMRLQKNGLKVSFQDSSIVDNGHPQNLANDFLLQFLSCPLGTDLSFLSIAGGINQNLHYQADLYVHLTDQRDEDDLGFIIKWKLNFERGNSRTSLERKFAITKRSSFRTLYNADAIEYLPAELASLFLSDLLAHLKHI